MVPFECMGFTKVALQIAKKEIRHWGVANIEEICGQVSERISCPVDQGFITTVLSAKKDFQWIDQPSGWFWLSSILNNRLFNRIKKVVSVSNQISVSELRAGIQRDRAMRGFAPPRRVILELCRQFDEFEVEDDVIVLSGHLDWRDILDENEKMLVQVFQQHGALLNRTEIENIWSQLNMNKSTLYAYLSFSPIILRYAPCIYGLAGVNIRPGDLDSIPSGKPSKVRKDFGWTKDGHIWIGYELSKGMCSESGLNHCPLSPGHIILLGMPILLQQRTDRGDNKHSARSF